MSRPALLLLLLPIALVSAGRVININEQVDKSLLALDRILTEKRLGLIVLRQTELGEELTCGTGVLLGLNSIRRTGNCTVEVIREGVKLTTLRLGHRLLSTSHGILRYKGDEMSGMTKFKYNNFDFSFAVYTNNRSCRVDLRKYEFSDLGKVMFYSSLEKYDGTDITGFARRHLLPALNKRLSEERRSAQWHLEEMICRHRGLSSLAEIYADLLPASADLLPAPGDLQPFSAPPRPSSQEEPQENSLE